MRLRFVILISALVAAPRGHANDAATEAERRRGFGEKWIATRLSIGAQFTHFWLEDDRRAGENGYDNSNITGNFLGSLWGLDAQQHYFPSPYLEYRVVSAFGLGVGYDQVRAKTLDWGADWQLAGDGDLELRGVGVYLVARYRNRSRFAPYATVGFSWYQSQFYVSPGWLLPGRRFVAEDTDGWFASAGCRVRGWKHLAVDLAVRHAQIDKVAARAYVTANRYRGGAFPMRHDALALGLVYTF